MELEQQNSFCNGLFLELGHNSLCRQLFDSTVA